MVVSACFGYQAAPFGLPTIAPISSTILARLISVSGLGAARRRPDQLLRESSPAK